MGMLENYLQKYFAFKDFRNGQKEIIESILNKKDTLVVMPTGGGKSICYQLPAMLLEGTAIIISPLIALMKDQADALAKTEIPATFINSSLDFSEYNARMEKALNGQYKLLYISPERLENSYFIAMLSRLHVSFLAVDEAHCISEWGHDFRPAYLNIAKALDNIHISHIVALTATATPEVQNDIVKILHMDSPNLMIRGFDRKNLNYITEQTGNKLERTCEIIANTREGSSIIYCGSRKNTEEIHNGLKNNGIAAVMYHGGMSNEERKRNQEKFINDGNSIIVATNAFGMGIDKSNVRNVIHCNLTGSIEAYYQEAGRAGRDGLPANCYLLYANSDLRLQKYFIDSSYPPKNDFVKIFDYLKLQDRQSINHNEAKIAATVGISEAKVNTILNYFERCKVISRQNAAENAKIKFSESKEELLKFIHKTTRRRADVLEAILRNVTTEAMLRYVDIDVNYILRKYDIKENIFHEAVRYFKLLNLLDFQEARDANSIIIENNFTNFDNLNEININFENLYYRKSVAEEKLKTMQEYADTKECKRNFILNYFNDYIYSGNCEKCSSCNKSKSQSGKFPHSEMLQLILAGAAELNGKFGRYVLAEYLKGGKSEKIKQYELHKGELYGVLSDISKEKLIKQIDDFVDNRLLNISDSKYPTISVSTTGKSLLTHKIRPLNIKYAKQESAAIPKAIVKTHTHVEKIPEDIKKINNLFASGLSIDEVAKKMKMTKGDVANNLQKAIELFPSLNWRDYASAKDYQNVRQILHKSPYLLLKDIQYQLPEALDFSLLRVIAAFAKKESGKEEKI